MNSNLEIEESMRTIRISNLLRTQLAELQSLRDISEIYSSEIEDRILSKEKDLEDFDASLSEINRFDRIRINLEEIIGNISRTSDILKQMTNDFN